ncbi:ankyrin repeat domain-containing protein 10 isoform X1 [Oryzias latipes]|uniref:Ankyrin repeat domain 10a n=1 Tax=Oryzias latipes TaxID=8090 RepID=H2N2D1_ORYLA|nr:ankyrin repeat domain-containing protein 10 isoform X1 [Oryzias latipes]
MSAGLSAEKCGEEVFFTQFPVHRACRDGDVGALVPLLQQLSHRAPLTAEDSYYGWTPIHWAAHYGRLECVVLLVQMGCEVNTTTSRFNQTPTHTAAFGGHPHCLVWLTQAGADINKQDCVGEAPIHKAARSGSLDCVQVLLIAGAEPHLRNASGQTAADLAHANGFHDCFCFISRAQTRLGHLRELHAHLAQGEDRGPASQGPPGRKRQQNTVEGRHVKKARQADGVSEQMKSSAGEEEEEEEGMNLEQSSGDHTKATVIGCTPPPTPLSPMLGNAEQTTSVAPPLDNRNARRAHQPSADMCGSLHLSGAVNHRSDWWSLMEAGGGDLLQYGHFHGFGDTAEDLSDGGKPSPAGTPILLHCS